MDEDIEVPIYNLWTETPYIVLKPGEEICPQCEGAGLFNRTHYGHQVCYLCFGSGKVDWIKRIRGV